MLSVSLTVWPEGSYGGTSRLGPSDYVFSFFSSVSYYLEGRNCWGKRFPRLLVDLCNYGVVENQHLDELADELKIIYNELEMLPITKIIYDIDDLNKPVPWKLLKGAEQNTLSDAWYAPRSGMCYFDVFMKHINDAKNRNDSLNLIYAPEVFSTTFRKPMPKGRKYWLGMVPIYE